MRNLSIALIVVSLSTACSSKISASGSGRNGNGPSANAIDRHGSGVPATVAVLVTPSTATPIPPAFAPPQENPLQQAPELYNPHGVNGARPARPIPGLAQ
jgi:hypothetical protein